MSGIPLGPSVPEREESRLGPDQVECGDPGHAGVREGVPGASPPLRHAGLDRRRGERSKQVSPVLKLQSDRRQVQNSGMNY